MYVVIFIVSYDNRGSERRKQSTTDSQAARVRQGRGPTNGGWGSIKKGSIVYTPFDIDSRPESLTHLDELWTAIN